MQICVLLCLAGFFFSCNYQNNKEDKLVNGDSLEMVQEENAMLARQKKREEDFTRNMQKKGYRFVCTKECDGSALIEIEGRKVEYEQLHVETILIGDSLYIDLQFKEACCQEFSGDVEKSGDTLKLTYSPNGEMVCACTCEYNYRFSLPAQKYKSKYLTVNGYLIRTNQHITKRKTKK